MKIIQEINTCIRDMYNTIGRRTLHVQLSLRKSGEQMPSVYEHFRLVLQTVAKSNYQLEHVCHSIHLLHRTTRHSREENA